MQKAFLILIFLLGVQENRQNEAQNFYSAKKILLKKFEDKETKSFYCQVPIKIKNNKFVLLKSDKYTPRNKYTKKGKINKKALRVEFEHIMPAHRFGKDLACWRFGGRKACQKDPLFRKMEGDINNIVLAIGEINQDRKNFEFAQAPKGTKYTQYGACRVYTDFKNKRFYPAWYSKKKLQKRIFICQKNMILTYQKKKRFC